MTIGNALQIVRCAFLILFGTRINNVKKTLQLGKCKYKQCTIFIGAPNFPAHCLKKATFFTFLPCRSASPIHAQIIRCANILAHYKQDGPVRSAKLFTERSSLRYYIDGTKKPALKAMLTEFANVQQNRTGIHYTATVNTHTTHENMQTSCLLQCLAKIQYIYTISSS